MLNTALNWVLRMVCCAIIFLGSAAIFAGSYLTDSAFVELFKTESYYPHIQHLHGQLVPHHQQLLVGGTSAVVLALLCGFLLLFLAQQSSTTSDHGSAKWAGFWTIVCAHLAPLRRPRFILGKRGLLTVALPKHLQYQQVIIVAPNGQWKTTGFITPNLFEERGQRGIITFDLKGELLQVCGGALSRYLQVLVWAPLELPTSIHYNPLRHVSTEEDAADLAACWIDNTGLSPVSFYNDTAQLLVQAAILHLVDTEPGAPFSRLADLLGTASFAEVKKLLTSSQSQRAREIGAAFLVNISTDPSMAGKIMAGMSTRFLVMRNRTIHELTADHPDPERNLDFHQLVTAPQALFLNIPVPDVKRLQPITAALSRQLLTHLIRHPHQRGVAFYLDELCNAGRIPKYAEQISIVRGFNIALFQVIQNFAQLRSVYGQDGMESILENSNTKVFLPGLGKVESEYASDLAGEDHQDNEPFPLASRLPPAGFLYPPASDETR